MEEVKQINHTDSIKSNELFQEIKPETYYSRHPRPVLLGDQLRNADNIGAIIRLADNIGAREAQFIGEAEHVSATKIQRCAASSYRNIPWQFTTIEAVDSLIEEGYSIVCIETAVSAENLFDVKLARKAAFVVGHEVHGIRPELMAKAHQSVYIPVPGPTRSLNVSHAMAVTLFEWWRQMQISK